MTFSVDALTARLLTGAGDPPPADGQRRAAVAALLHHGEHGLAVLLMKRAERTGDPWSGQVSLPGGRHEPDDPDLHTTAVREAEEELALGLTTGARYLGRLAALHPRSGGPAGMEVTPFVFVTDAPPTPRLGAEAAAAFWLPIPLVLAGSLDGTYDWPNEASGARLRSDAIARQPVGPGPPAPMRFPCWQWQGFTIWGLTMRIVGELLAAGRP